MSGSALAVVRLDVLKRPEIERAADAVLVFLISRCVVADSSMDGSWVPGPAYREVLTDAALEWYAERNSILRMDRVQSEVVVHRQWRGFFAMSAFEAPRCPRCGAACDEDEYFRDHEDWWRRREPVLRCRACGVENLQGSWIGNFANAFGAPAVEFVNWEELRPEFVSELRNVMGGRTAYVCSDS